MKTKPTYIPDEILLECAYAAHHATDMHYGHYGPESTKEWFDNEPASVQKNVLRDVKAVLYGNSTPAQLHEAWAARKLKAVGGSYNKLKKLHPTAILMFGHLTLEDQRGYETFVETVKKTYANANSAVEQTAKPCGARLFESSAADCTNKFGPVLGERALIEVYFDTFEQAQDFYNSLVKQ